MNPAFLLDWHVIMESKREKEINMGYFLAAVMGYLLGCSNLAYYISRAAKKDIRRSGSGNLGASNAAILFSNTSVVVFVMRVYMFPARFSSKSSAPYSMLSKVYAVL